MTMVTDSLLAVTLDAIVVRVPSMRTLVVAVAL